MYSDVSEVGHLCALVVKQTDREGNRQDGTASQRKETHLDAVMYRWSVVGGN